MIPRMGGTLEGEEQGTHAPWSFLKHEIYPLLFFSTENVPPTIFQYRYVLTAVCEKLVMNKKSSSAIFSANLWKMYYQHFDSKMWKKCIPNFFLKVTPLIISNRENVASLLYYYIYYYTTILLQYYYTTLLLYYDANFYNFVTR